jgi:hypothetical protein
MIFGSSSSSRQVLRSFWSNFLAKTLGKNVEYPLQGAIRDNSPTPLVWRIIDVLLTFQKGVKWRDLEVNFTIWRMMLGEVLSIYGYAKTAIAFDAAIF